MQSIRSLMTRRRMALVMGVAALAIATTVYAFRRPRHAAASNRPAGSHPAGQVAGATPENEAAEAHAVVPISLSEQQQRAVGLEVQPVRFARATEVIEAPGQVMPDETKYAFITPRAAGVVRSVAVHEGQDVRAGDLLATIDSPDVAKARFDLYTDLQELEVAKAEAAWEETIYDNTVALLGRLKAGVSPDQIHNEFENRPVGSSREKLITAYADLRLAKVTLERNTEMHKQGIVPAKQFQQVRAETHAAEAAYTSLTEEMEFTARIERTHARNDLRKAETAVRVARERLRVLGVRSDGTEPEVKGGKVVGVVAGTDAQEVPARGDKREINPAAILPHDAKPDADAAASPETRPVPVPPAPKAVQPNADADKPVSSYSIWAPFDGTILDRMMMVPGVYVDTTNRIFTMADLSTVWIEVHVHETHFGLFSHSRDARVSFTSPAYPGRKFDAEVIYRGDVVEPVSRTLKLLARAQNPERLLKPGMFVNVAIRLPSDRPAAVLPADAVLTEGTKSVVYVRTAPERFERRPVVVGADHGAQKEVVDGLKAGEEIVVRGAFKLKAVERQGGAPAEGPAELMTGVIR